MLPLASSRPHGVLVVDKARGPTSHDLVRLARRALGTREVGHAGTLDPMATGVLVLGVGEGTKLLRYLGGDDKTYVATVRLGLETDTLDADGRGLREDPNVLPPTREQVQAVAQTFVGPRLQRAPAVSAIKQGGVALYERVRRGEEVVAPERVVVVHELEILRVVALEIELRVHCSKGFYVRALARDLAQALGTFGHLTALRRIASGGFSLEGALPFEQLEQAGRGELQAKAQCRAALVPVHRGLPRASRVQLSEAGAQAAFHGRAVLLEHTDLATLPPEGTEPLLLCSTPEQPIALARVRGGHIEVVRGLRLPSADGH